MAITAYVGLPGHGKSYGVVENVIIPALKQMRSVFTNIPMNNEKCLAEFGIAVTQFDINDIIKNANWWDDVFIAGSVLVLDEAWRLWPSGLKATNVRESDRGFLAEHRHIVGESGLSTEIVIVTQDLQQIASFARCLVDTTYRVLKLSTIGLDKVYRLDVYQGAVTGANPPVSKRLNTINGKRRKYVEGMYFSHTKSKVGAGDETRIDGRFNVLRSQKVYFYIAFVVVALVVFYFASLSTLKYYGFSGSDEIKEADSVDNTPVKNVVVTNSSMQNALTQKPVSTEFKYLSLADSLYISYNNGRFPHIKYVFSVKIGETQADLIAPDLIALKYKVTPIAPCLVMIKGPDFDSAVMCGVSDKKESVFQKVVTEGKV